jgi:hypothetical protein
MNQYPNSGKLSHNPYKEEGDRKPDFFGEIVMQRSALKQILEETDLDDIAIKLSAWTMSGNKGPWYRLAWNNYKPKEEIRSAPPKSPPPKANPQVALDDLDDIPF